KPLGTAGAVLAGLDQLDERFAVMYGDTMVNVDLTRFWSAHAGSGADATLFLHPNNHPLDSDLVEMNAEGWITAFHNRPHPEGTWFQNLVNAGPYVIEKRALRGGTNSTSPHLSVSNLPVPTECGTPNTPLDFGKDLFPAMLRAGARLFGYNSPE